MDIKNRNKRKLSHTIILIFLLIASALFLFFIFNNGNSSWLSSTQNEATKGEVTAIDVSNKVEKDTEFKNDVKVVQVFNTLPYMSEEDLVENSTLIIRGTVTGQSDSFEIMSVTGGISPYTDHYVEVSQVLRGSSAEKGDTVSVRISGGQIGSIVTVVEGTPTLKENDEVLLYLKKPTTGGGFNTEGDYYYVVGSSQGAYILDKSNKERTGIERFATSDGEAFAFSEAVKEISAFSEKYPVNESIAYEQLLESLKNNLETGVITQEEYDLTIENRKKYATIIK